MVKSQLLHTQFYCLDWLLAGGMAVSAQSRMPKLLLRLKHPFTSAMHWGRSSAWGMVEALSSVLEQQNVRLLRAAHFFSISLDEATTTGT